MEKSRAYAKSSIPEQNIVTLILNIHELTVLFRDHNLRNIMSSSDRLLNSV